MNDKLREIGVVQTLLTLEETEVPNYVSTQLPA